MGAEVIDIKNTQTDTDAVTKNKLYKLSGTKKTYAVWVDEMGKLYSTTGNKSGLPFLVWLNYKVQSDNEKPGFFKSALGVINIAAQTYVRTKELQKESTDNITPVISKPPDTRIMGMKPVLFYSAVVVVIVLISVGTYAIIKKQRK
jgi:hypothetical protein